MSAELEAGSRGGKKAGFGSVVKRSARSLPSIVYLLGLIVNATWRFCHYISV